MRRARRGARLASVDWVRSTGSTNSDLLAADGGDERVLVADVQTAGRGRMGRVWEADPGTSLLMSVRVVVGRGGPHDPQLALALAVVDVVATHGASVSLKWPNDVLANGQKLAGLLAESASVGGRVAMVVVGLGLNVRWTDGLPDGAIDLSSLGVEIDRTRLVIELLDAMVAHLEADPVDRAARYAQVCSTIGSTVRVEGHDGELVGRAVGLGPDGALVVRADGVDHTVRVGDVIHLR